MVAITATSLGWILVPLCRIMRDPEVIADIRTQRRTMQ